VRLFGVGRTWLAWKAGCVLAEKSKENMAGVCGVYETKPPAISQNQFKEEEGGDVSRTHL
jgi:hypothetical protein